MPEIEESERGAERIKCGMNQQDETGGMNLRQS